MPFTLTMPKLSPTMEEGSIVKWHKKEGEKVECGALLVEIATDKAVVEYNALDEGFLRSILVKEGSPATVNSPIAVFTLTKDENIGDYVPEPIAVLDPIKKEKEDLVGDLSSAIPPSNQFDTPVRKNLFTPEPPLTDYNFKFPTESDASTIKASPLAKKLAKEKGIDLSTIKGSGPLGRITSIDIDFGQTEGIVTFGKRNIPREMPGTYEEIPLSPMRKEIVKRLSQAATFIPHIYVRQTVNVLPLIEIKEQLKTGKLAVTFNDFIVRACALALKENPESNSGFNESSQSIILFKTIDIAIAVTLESGLITPIIRHVDYKNLGEISVEIKSLVGRAKKGKLRTEEYKGGSFTISNMGMFGVSDFCAIINPPQACILAVGGIEDSPIVKNGSVFPGKTMGLVLSADHRVIDGSGAAKFLKSIQKYIENPALLLV